MRDAGQKSGSQKDAEQEYKKQKLKKNLEDLEQNKNIQKIIIITIFNTHCLLPSLQGKIKPGALQISRINANLVSLAMLQIQFSDLTNEYLYNTDSLVGRVRRTRNACNACCKPFQEAKLQEL